MCVGVVTSLVWFGVAVDFIFEDTPFNANYAFLLLLPYFLHYAFNFTMSTCSPMVQEFTKPTLSSLSSPRFAMSQARGRLMIHDSLSCSLNKTCGSRIAGAVVLAKSC